MAGVDRERRNALVGLHATRGLGKWTSCCGTMAKNVGRGLERELGHTRSCLCVVGE